MRVKMTAALKAAMIAEGLNPVKFADDFRAWKKGHRYGSPFFGKDSRYSKPVIRGVKELKHVHLVPMIDLNALAAWKAAFSARKHKTSDRALIYVSKGKYEHLLIFILAEPTAHSVARMRTPAHRAIMEGFADVASVFLKTGKVIN